MGISFSGLQIALSSLQTSQKALATANNNIANAATPGYSRQVAEITTNDPYAASGSGMIGMGVNVSNINRIRDSYIDYRYSNENTAKGEWDIKKSSMEDLELLFNETDDTGLTKYMNNFYTSIQELSKDPSNMAARVQFKESAVSLSRQFNNMASELKDLQRNYNFAAKIKVDAINSTAQQIRDLNEQITKIELTGTAASDLRDKRQLLVDQLSKIVNIDVEEKNLGKLSNGIDDKRFIIKINGHMLVNHFNSYKIQYIQRTAAQRKNPSDIDGLYDFKWEDGNNFNFDGGELKGLIDVRDGNGDVTTGSMIPYKGVPYYVDRLNYFVRNFAKGINEGTASTKGFVDGYGSDGSTGIKLFTANGTDSASFVNYNTLTAENIEVSSDILATDGIKKIPASDTYGQIGNSNILSDILDNRHNTNMFAEGAPEDFMKSVIATLAVDSQEATKMTDLQDSIVKSIENKRQSISGVSIDEEMANVVKYQQIYTASAKFVSIMDQIYSITINSLGQAGR